ncbi:MAG: PorT family protein [Chitinophagales bacterium]|nr:PorT family protein [Chitinophagales bacterium]
MTSKILFCICLLSSFTVFAQKGLEFGLRFMPQGTGIINQTDFDEGDELNFQTTINFAYGIHAGYNFSDNVGLQTGLLLSQEGQKYVDDLPQPGDNTSELSLSYLQIPLLLKLNSNPHKGAHFVAHLGVQFGILNSVKYYENDVNISDTYAGFLGVDAKEVYKSADLSGVLGLGARYRLTDNLQIGSHLYLTYSVADIEDKDFAILGIPFWGYDRASSHNATAGILIELNYSLGGSDD